jgi:hypothetical protein
MWFDLLLIALAVFPLMHTAKFFSHRSRILYSHGDEMRLNHWPAQLQAAPAGRTHRVLER